MVEEVLGGLGPDYQLIAVVAEMFKDRWVLRIRAPQKIFNVEVQRELGDEVLDSSTLQDIDQLKNLLLSGVGREELIRKHEQV